MTLLVVVVVVFALVGAASANGGLKWLRVAVPQFKMPGESAVLQCDYDLGNDTLYAVKWYKDHEELYRFIPKARPQAISYPVEGVRIDMSKSDSRKMVLFPVAWKTSGLYRCEVSAEAPSFASAQDEARMEVIFFAQEDPVISGVQPQYELGDELQLNCTSSKSYPASVLQWYVNEQRITTPEALVQHPTIRHRQGLLASVLGLRFVLSDRHFQGGSMRIKCVASVWSALAKSDRESEVQNLPIKDMREALLLVKSSTIKSYYGGSSFLLLGVSILGIALT